MTTSVDSREWRKQPLQYSQWQDNCRASVHVRPGDIVTFTPPSSAGTIGCWIADTSVFLGVYFTAPAPKDGIDASTGWNK